MDHAGLPAEFDVLDCEGCLSDLRAAEEVEVEGDGVWLLLVVAAFFCIYVLFFSLLRFSSVDLRDEELNLYLSLLSSGCTHAYIHSYSSTCVTQSHLG